MKRLFLVVFFVLFCPAIVWAYVKDPGTAAALQFFGHILSASVGCGLGYLWSDKGKEYRDIVLRVTYIVMGGSFVVSTFMYAPFILDLAIIAATAYYTKKNNTARKTANKPAKVDTFGASEWEADERLAERRVFEKKGLLLGHRTEFDKREMYYGGDRHMLVVAPTRSGKGVSSILPNLLTISNSCVVFDPKGENALITYDRRGKGAEKIPGLGQEVHVVDPWGITPFPKSCFNPMDWLKIDDEDITENAMMLADAIVMTSSSDPFWDEESKSLLSAIILYVAIDMNEVENRNLGRVRDIICSSKSDFDEILSTMAVAREKIFGKAASIIRSAGDRTKAKDDRLRSNVMAALQSHTHFLDSHRIRESLSKSDFRFEDLKTKPMTIYLVLPADRLHTFGRWIRLLIQQALTVNTRNIENKPENPVVFVLDEIFSSGLGRLSMVHQAFSLMAGFGVQLFAVAQDLSQIEGTYGKGWETFIGNCGVLQYFGSRDYKTAEYFSKLCGMSTVEKTSKTKSFTRTITGQVSSSSSTESTSEDVVQRRLKFADELMVLRRGDQLLFIENLNPIKGKKIIWYRDPILKKLGVNLLPEESEPEIDRILREVEERRRQKIEAPQNVTEESELKKDKDSVENKPEEEPIETVAYKEPEEDLKKLTADLPTEPVVEEPEVKEQVKEQKVESSITKRVQERKEFERLQNFLEARGMKVNRNIDGGVTVIVGKKQEHRFASVEEFIKAAPDITGKK